MTTETIRVSGLIPATPRRVYDAWLDSREHSKFTGGKANITPGVGGEFTAWNGYISGKTLELEPGKRIVQSWRTTDFPAGAPDSRLEVLFESRGAGQIEIDFLHSGIPEGQGHKYEEGWVAHYLTKMRRYFLSPASQVKPKPKVQPAKSALRAKKAAEVVKKPAAPAAAAKKGAATKRVAKRVEKRKGKARPAAKLAARKKTTGKKAKAKHLKKRPAKKSRSR